ncbi:branched-chain amino acid ABC transporter permease [Georgenia sp. 10Sc9-8]|uniref:Branched-chain amino acid ABC transporter permease n=1 Tax=Georgenia halotolerans TaxID=3028317 RepID=A0ABT5TWR3_9MICO|nr:branched-chain amino acid ABC transporter permease [Georgenia halotolerans]
MLEGLVSGLVTGAAYALIGVSVVILHRLVGVLDFSQAAIGSLGAFTTYAVVQHGVPLEPAVLFGVTAAALAAGLVGWAVTRWLGNADVLARSTATIALLILLLSVGFRLFGDSPRVTPSLVPEETTAVLGVNVSTSTFLSLVLVLAVLAAWTFLQRRTTLGIRLQAIAERPVTAQLLGVDANRLRMGAWIAVGVLSALAILLIAPTQNPTFLTMSLLVVPGLAAGLIGGLENAGLAAAGGLAMGALQGLGARVELIAGYRGALPFVVIVLVLAWLRRRETWARDD